MSASLPNDSLIRSRWRFQPHQLRTPTFLRSLGIPFRQVAGKTFWEANAAQLPELRAEMQEEARDRLHLLHPDKGGEAREFSFFFQNYERAKKNFAWHLPKAAPLPPPQEVLDTAGARFRDPSKAFLVANLYLAGEGTLAIMRQTGCTNKFTRKVRGTILAGRELGCRCGRTNGHKGTCRHRWPGRSTFWRSQKGFETRARIAKKMRGRRDSAETTARKSAAQKRRVRSAKELERVRTWRIGKHLTPEQKEHLRKLWLGRGKGVPRSPAVRARISAGTRAAMARHKRMRQLLAA